MKKVLQHAITALLAAFITYLVVTKIDSNRLNRDAAKYERELDLREAKIAELSKGAPGASPALASTPSAAAATAVPKIRYDAATTGSKCRMDGASSIHDWKMETAIIGGYFEIDSRVNFDLSQATLSGADADGRITAAAANMPVRSFKSYNTRMDEVYLEHMDAIKFRRIEYTLKELVLKKAPHAPNTPFEFDSKGDLTVHGVTNTISMPVKIMRADANQLKITGTTPLNMTDFKVQPPCPTIAGVTITTSNAITVNFEWFLTPANPNMTQK